MLPSVWPWGFGRDGDREMSLLLTPKSVTIPSVWEVLALEASPEVVVGISNPRDWDLG